MTRMRTIAALLASALLTACASYDGRGLEPGRSDHMDVLRLMGPPAQQWDDADGGRQLAYPRGPAGVHTYMVRIDAAGKLASIENVLKEERFAAIKEGMQPEEVLRLLGPVYPVRGTTYFPARDELVMEWLYCDSWSERSRFYVLFDGTTRTVRSTMSINDPECRGRLLDICWCGR
jgi:hypothetical protein